MYLCTIISKPYKSKVDLSRRQTTYTLYGMSFREFLAYEGVLTHDALTFEDIL